jgi:hypothetical protein
MMNAMLSPGKPARQTLTGSCGGYQNCDAVS